MRMLQLITKQRKRRKGVSLWTTCVMVVSPGLIMSGCGSNDFLGLEDYQRELLIGFGVLAIALLSDGQGDGTEPPIGQAQPGDDGLSCWDTNGNRLADAEEDVNGDGLFDALDCRGTDGEAGARGLSCWDINGNGSADASEDINGDGFFTAADCGGSGGGLSCWDINGNGFADPEEDVNGDGSFDAVDCQGPRGFSGGGSTGATGAAGADGLPCWDLNGDGIGQPEEDVNGDESFDALDCQGAAGANGQPGAAGADGLNCWDLDGDGIGQPREDVNGDGFFDTLDCQGAAGTDGQPGTAGLHCWDLNGDGVGEPIEDIDGDGFFTVLDCRGADGANGADGATGLSCWDTNHNGIGEAEEDIDGDGEFTALDCQGADGQDGTNGLSCWDLDGDGQRDPEEDINGDGAHDALDCRGPDGNGPAAPMMLFDMFIDAFFTIDDGSHASLSFSGGMVPEPIDEPILGEDHDEVVAYRWAVPQLYDETGVGDPGVDQNLVVMRLYLWREGPIEDCFVLRLDAFRGRHGSGIMTYGDTRYLKLDDPELPDPVGTMVVVDLPLNNGDGATGSGLSLPADLRVGDFLAFELNIIPESKIDRDVTYAMLGVEFFEAPADTALVQHATVFNSLDDVDCSFFVECSSDSDCDDGTFCNGEATCNDEGRCEPGAKMCEHGQMCDEVDDVCVPCDDPFDRESGHHNGSDSTHHNGSDSGNHHGGDEDKVVICHTPPGNAGSSQTLVVSVESLPAHLAHGDRLGLCDTDCGDLE